MVLLPKRSDLRGESPYGAPQLEVPVRLNVNENPYPPSAAVTADIAARVAGAASSLNRYPDRDFAQLRGALADYLAEESGVRLAPEQIWAANGSNEVMLQLLQAFGGPEQDQHASGSAGAAGGQVPCGTQTSACTEPQDLKLRTVASFAPTYSMYPEYARDAFTRYVAGARRPDFSLDLAEVRRVLEQERPAVLLLASPNNPTGTALAPEELYEVLVAAQESGPQVRVPVRELETGAGRSQGAHHFTTVNWSADLQPEDEVPLPASTIVVVDEAYGEFRREGVPSALELLDEFPNLVVCRTMSKAFGAAGLRLGYMAASREIIEQVMLVRLPYHLSAVTQAAALAALEHRHELMAQVAAMRADRDQLAADLRALGFEAPPSDANFVFFGKFADRHAVWQGLLDRGVLIREVGPDGWLRVSVGTPAENAAFLAALKEVTAKS